MASGTKYFICRSPLFSLGDFVYRQVDGGDGKGDLSLIANQATLIPYKVHIPCPFNAATRAARRRAAVARADIDGFISDNSASIDHVGQGKPSGGPNPLSVIWFIVAVGYASELLILRIFAKSCGLICAYTDYHEAITAMTLIKAVNNRHLLFAWRTPGRPIVHQNDLAVQFGEIKRLTVQLGDDQ